MSFLPLSALDSTCDKALLDPLAQEYIDEQRRERRDDQRGSDGTPVRRILSGESLDTNRKCPQRCLADKDIREHQLIPALQECVDAYRSNSRLHQRHDDAEKDPPCAAAVDTC